MLSTVTQQFRLFSVLRHRDFRLYWVGLLFQVGGHQMMLVTFGWLAFELTGSPLFVGSVALFAGLPPLTVGLFGGVFADRLDQRRIIGIAQGLGATGAAVLAVLTITDQVQIWYLVLMSLLLGTVQAFEQPSRQALYPRLLPQRSLLALAVPLNAMTWQSMRIGSPSIAGFIIATAGSGRTQGAGPSFAVSAATFLFVALMIQRVRPVHGGTASTSNILRSLLDGARYVRGHSLFRTVLGMTYVNSLFGMGYIFVLPVFAAGVLGADSRGLGLLWSAGGIGSFVGVLTTPAIVRHIATGKVMVTQGLLFGGSLVAVALARELWLAVVLLVPVGLGSLAYMMAVEVTLQSLVPDDLRGRVMSLNVISWAIPPVGAAGLTVIANFAGAPAAIALGGGVVCANVLLVFTFSSVIRHLGVVGVERSEPSLVAPPAADAASRRA